MTTPTPDFRALLHPGYELGDGSADGAQQVGGQWWHPVMGCDSLQFVVDNALTIAPPEPPTDDELNALWNCCGNHDEEGDHYGNIFQFARAVLKRWGAK
jgi:hypothetical protein